ncbi:MAG: hypothetical protein HY925_07795 [Elusimicrobia bacterium]|nr:hypothetical protein [Elusimicrobiota bacterium]
MLAIVARGLKDLREKVVFVGGATVDLYLSAGAPETRATDDVDCVVELGTRAAYHKLEEKLRGLGFQHPIDERGPICRWRFMGIKVDVMPQEGAVLGFSNRWYRDGMANAETCALPGEQDILVFSVPYLLASKFEAFRNRGKDDYLASPDLEDIVALFDGCPEISEKVTAAPADVRKYLADQCKDLLQRSDFIAGIDGHLGGSKTEERRRDCLAVIQRVAAIGE